MNFNIQESRSQVMSPSRSNEIIRKSCLDCHTTKTPCWRGGPSGPRTLCNACGIRYRKKKMVLLGLNRQSSVLEKSKTRSDNTLKMELLTFGRGNRREIVKEEWRKNAGEEEKQAAMLLMAMSCGSVYA